MGIYHRYLSSTTIDDCHLMQEYISPISSKELSRTNKNWNKYQLNTPWSVGMVSSLIKRKPFESSSEWKAYYLSNGDLRSKGLKKMSSIDRYILNYVRQDTAHTYYGHSQRYKHLQHQYGRSRSIIAHRAYILNRSMNHRYGMTLAYDIVLFRIVGETWNGIILRERRTIERLEERFKDIQIRHCPAEDDYQYAIDYKIYREDIELCAIQIKPLSYASDKPYIQKAHRANLKKNSLYTEQTNIPVYTILSDIKGHLKEDKGLFELKDRIENYIR